LERACLFFHVERLSASSSGKPARFFSVVLSCTFPFCPLLPRIAPYCPILPRTAPCCPDFPSPVPGCGHPCRCCEWWQRRWRRDSRTDLDEWWRVRGGRSWGRWRQCGERRRRGCFGCIRRERAMPDRRLPAATTAALRRSGTGVGWRTDLFLCAVGAKSNLL